MASRSDRVTIYEFSELTRHVVGCCVTRRRSWRGDHLRFDGLSEDEFIQLHASGLLSVTTVSDATVIGWGDGSITLQQQALNFDSLLNSGYIEFMLI